MKLASLVTSHGVHPGAVVGDEIVDLAVAEPTLPGDVAEILAGGETAAELVRRAVRTGLGRLPLDGVRLAAPVRPRKYFGIGLNFAAHAAESAKEVPAHLTVFLKASTCVIGPYDDVILPNVSKQLDYEGELAFVIGRRCRHVRAQDAPKVVGGYTIANDVSVRDWQLMTSQWTLGKSFDTHGPVGPWIVTSDELSDPHHLEIRTFVSGELRQQGCTSDLVFNCFEQVEILSAVCTLEPGDIIATGTPAGVALGMERPIWLKPGDRVKVEIDEIGWIENRVVAEKPSSQSRREMRGGPGEGREIAPDR